MPLPAAVATAEMHADAHLRQAGENAIGYVDVSVDQRIWIISARTQCCLHVRIAELGERRLVDLHITAAGLRERTQFALKCRDDVLPEFVYVVVCLRRHRRIAATEMQRAGAGNGDLRQRCRACAQKCEIGRIDGAFPGDAVFARCHGLRAAAAGFAGRRAE